MIVLTEKDLEYEWGLWGDDPEGKPWQCPECKNLMSIRHYKECTGTDPYMPKEEWTPHRAIKATRALTFTEFAKVAEAWLVENKK